MTHLGKTIQRIIAQHPYGFSAQVARKIGVSPAYICRLQNGERKGISTEVLARLAIALTKQPSERAELIVAHLKDESCGYWPDRICIKIK